LLAAPGSVAAVTALLCAALANCVGWRPDWLLAVVGLCAGLCAAALPLATTRSRIGSGWVGAGIGLALLNALTGQGTWQAQTQVPDGELDELCVRIVALRTCHTQEIMGVFDFADVPPAICEQARREVAQMLHPQKLALVDQTFASRINEASAAQSAGLVTVCQSGLHYLLAFVAAAIPAALRQRGLNPSEGHRRR
jgi:hypothetical protein